MEGAAVVLQFGWYNFVWNHRSLDMTPAMAPGVTDQLWKLDDLLGGIQ